MELDSYAVKFSIIRESMEGAACQVLSNLYRESCLVQHGLAAVLGLLTVLNAHHAGKLVVETRHRILEKPRPFGHGVVMGVVTLAVMVTAKDGGAVATPVRLSRSHHTLFGKKTTERVVDRLNRVPVSIEKSLEQSVGPDGVLEETFGLFAVDTQAGADIDPWRFDGLVSFRIVEQSPLIKSLNEARAVGGGENLRQNHGRDLSLPQCIKRPRVFPQNRFDSPFNGIPISGGRHIVQFEFAR